MEPHHKDDGPHPCAMGNQKSGGHAMVQERPSPGREENGSTGGEGREGKQTDRYKRHLEGGTEWWRCGRASGSNSCFKGSGKTCVFGLQNVLM